MGNIPPFVIDTIFKKMIIFNKLHDLYVNYVYLTQILNLLV